MKVFEVVLYSVLNFLPYLFIALYPFRNSLRFSKPVTAALIMTSTVLQVLVGLWVGIWGGNAAGLSIISTAMYAFFYILVVRTDFGKALFTLLMISNIANLIITSSKCIEGALFPDMAHQGYRWTFSLIMALMQAAVLIPFTFYISHTYSKALEKDTAKPTWRFLWLIPATFYVEWYYRLYTSTASSLEFAMKPSNTVFLLIINLGALLIYHMVILHILTIDANVELSEQNHALTMQKLQYENLRERIAETRQAKHDIRHHIITLMTLLNDEKYDEAKAYLEEYRFSMPDDMTISFCRNYTVNALLLFFAQQAKNKGIDFDASVDVPENIGVPDSALSVLLGNLLENAIAANEGVAPDKRKVVIRSASGGGSILFKITNPYSGELKQNKDGLYLSTKHEGRGIGLASVRSIVARNGGRMEISHADNTFSVTVMLTES